MESLTANVDRLKAYRARLILFPRRSGKPKQGDSSQEEVKAAKSGEGLVRHVETVLPIEPATGKGAVYSEVPKGEMGEGEKAAYRRLRDVRSEARLVGVREKRAKAKAEEAQTQKK